MRALNMQALTTDIDERHPGVTIYGKGDEAHQLRPSDHNEDDTPGSKPAQTDADNNPEHRAIDVMIGKAFTKAQAYTLINDILGDVNARVRLQNIIFDGWIWSRSVNWARREYTGSDDHSGHIHFSGHAADDENGANWPAVVYGGAAMATVASQVNNLYAAYFYGGSSCGSPVADKYRTRKPDGTFANPNGNSLVEQLAEIRGELAEVRATSGGSDDQFPSRLRVAGILTVEPTDEGGGAAAVTP